MSDFSLLTLIAIPTLLLWIAIFGLRIVRLLRFFQLEGYDSRRYFRWFWRQPNERRFLATALISAMLILTLSVSTDFLNQSLFATVRIAVVALSALSAAFHLASRPREQQAKQSFTRTSRGLRLLGAAILIAITFFLTASLFWRPLYGSLIRLYSAGTTRILIAYNIEFWWIATIAAPITLPFLPLTLPLANVILWPIEEAFRRYYLRMARRNLVRSGATVIAITGSYGKTSTKHYLNHILAGRYRVLMTPKSYNTLLGISRVINDILSKDVSYDYFIVEAGAYIPGEIAQICKLVRPQISMVITVGPMHLERFGSIENVVRAKYEIIESLPQDGVGVFNADAQHVRGMAERGYPPDPKHRILVTQQNAPGARLAATNVRMTAEGLDFDVRDNETNEERTMHAPLYGEHNVTNILMAMAVARHLGMSLAEIAMRVATLEPAEHRLNRVVMPNGTILIDDAYSANPVGTRTALDVLALHNSGARRVVVSSGMFELGPLHEEENRKLGEQLAEVASDVILIGKAQTEPVQAGLQEKKFPADHLHVVDTLNEAVQIYKGLLRPGDALLILTDLPDTYA